MHRSSAGGLASLTANYTDSDASDPENDDEDAVESEQDNRRRTTHSTNIASNDVSNLSSLAIDQAESATNSVSEMGHITDEEQSDTSDKGDIEDDDYVYNNNRSNESPVEDVQIPPEPPGWCSKQLQDKIAEKYELMLREGLDSNAVIQNQKKFRNPSIYEKLIQFCQIDEMGTNYSPDVYDPRQFDSSSYYEELAKAQKTEMDRRQKEQKERTKIEFLSGTKKTVSAVDTRDESKKRKSKWDVAGNNVVLGPQPKPIGVSQPTTVVSMASATKATVISAFGTIAKKPKQ